MKPGTNGVVVQGTGKENRMPRIQPLEPGDAPEQSRELMEQGEQAVGQMVNYFKQMAVSPASFKAYMDFNSALQDGALKGLQFGVEFSIFGDDNISIA